MPNRITMRPQAFEFFFFLLDLLKGIDFQLLAWYKSHRLTVTCMCLNTNYNPNQINLEWTTLKWTQSSPFAPLALDLRVFLYSYSPKTTNSRFLSLWLTMKWQVDIGERRRDCTATRFTISKWSSHSALSKEQMKISSKFAITYCFVRQTVVAA